jgi:hypothetical protein
MLSCVGLRRLPGTARGAAMRADAQVSRGQVDRAGANLSWSCEPGRANLGGRASAGAGSQAADRATGGVLMPRDREEW